MNSFDRAINNDFLVVSKSLLPYLNIDRQKPIALFIKMMELIYTFNLFSDETTVRSMYRGQEAGWEKDFLRDVKSNLPNEKAVFVDAVLKLAEAKDLLARKEQSDPAYREPGYHLHPEDSGIPEDEPFPDQTPLPRPVQPNSTPHNTQGPNPNAINPEQLINSLSSMLDPNQAQLIKMLISLLKPQS